MSKRTILVIGAAFTVLFLASSLIYVGRGGAQASAGQLPQLPPMTMVYEVDGRGISIGERPIQASKELHRLEYQSWTEWVDTVIEAPSVDVGRYGVASNVGSYTSVNGKAITEYDAMVGSTNGSTVSEDSIFVPHPALVPRRPDLLDASPKFTRSRVATGAKVCFNGECEENAVGILYKSDRIELVLVDDSRGIPLRLGDGFLVREVEIHDIRR